MPMIFQARGFKFTFPSKNCKTLIMGIINLTPDSFSGDGSSGSPHKALKLAQKMEKEGADILDLGAESTRPGARALSAREELSRLLPPLRKIRKAARLPLSVDTQKPEVAYAALEEGADIINDVSCLRYGPETADIVKRHKAGYILMHSRGTSRTMSSLNKYRKVVPEVIKEMRQALDLLKDLGLDRRSIAADPGVGFAKTGAQNLELIGSIEQFQKLGYPICVGLSRKSFIGDLVGKKPAERDLATTVLHSLLVERKVQILRVHSVEAAKQAVLVTQAFVNSQSISGAMIE
jgi:dihydropteroate synthase